MFLHVSSVFPRLPIELVAHIFELTLTADVDEDNEDNDEVIVLPYYRALNKIIAVCRHFRNVVHSTALLWTTVSDLMHLNLVDVSLVRSREAGLRVFLTFPERNGKDTRPFLNRVLSHCHRWRSFTLLYNGACNSNHLMRAHVSEAYERLRGLRVDMLKNLEWQLPPSRGNEGFTEGGCHRADADEYHAYRTWTAPLLKNFNGEEMLPRTSAPSTGPGFCLTACSFILAKSNWPAMRKPLNALMKFLESQPSLEVFGLVIGRHLTDEELEMKTPLVLPSLRTFVITADDSFFFSFHPPSNSQCIILKILHCLAFPLITEMLVVTTFWEHDFDIETAIFPSFNDYSFLARLQLVLYYDGGRKARVSPFRPIFKRAPGLQRLRIAMLDLEVMEEDFRSQALTPPPLKELQIHDSPEMTQSALTNVLQFLSHAPTWGEFEKLRIADCPNLLDCRKAVEPFLPEEKVEIHDGNAMVWGWP